MKRAANANVDRSNTPAPVGTFESFKQILEEREAVRQRYARRPVGKSQLQILVRLAAIWNRQKAEARCSRRRFQNGWTYVRTSRHARLVSLRGLIRRGLVSACCEGHDGTDAVRITDLGISHLRASGLMP